MPPADARPELRLAAPIGREPVKVVSLAERGGSARQEGERPGVTSASPSREADARVIRAAVRRPRRAPAPMPAAPVPAVAAVAAAAYTPALPITTPVVAMHVVLPTPASRAAAIDLSTVAGSADAATGEVGQRVTDPPKAPAGIPGVALPQAGTAVAPESCLVVPGRGGRGLGALVESVGRGNREGDPRAGLGGGWRGRRPF